jgi:predicted RNase H-like HicB family nuclease
MVRLKYEITIKWSDEDECFLVGFPDFPNQQWRTHGDTYEVALNNGIEALESLIEAYNLSGETLPQPKTVQVI